MSVIRKGNVICYSFKEAFTNFVRTQSSWKMLNEDRRTLSYKLYRKIYQPHTNYRTVFISRKLSKEIKKVTITFVRHDGVKLKKVVPVGEPINTIFEPDGDEIPRFGSCGGATECATCHVVVPSDLVDKLEEPTDEELDTIIYANEYDEKHSRLGCCVNVTEDLDGAELYVPKIISDKRDLK